MENSKLILKIVKRLDMSNRFHITKLGDQLFPKYIIDSLGRKVNLDWIKKRRIQEYTENPAYTYQKENEEYVISLVGKKDIYHEFQIVIEQGFWRKLLSKYRGNKQFLTQKEKEAWDAAWDKKAIYLDLYDSSRKLCIETDSLRYHQYAYLDQARDEYLKTVHGIITVRVMGTTEKNLIKDSFRVTDKLEKPYLPFPYQEFLNYYLTTKNGPELLKLADWISKNQPDLDLETPEDIILRTTDKLSWGVCKDFRIKIIKREA